MSFAGLNAARVNSYGERAQHDDVFAAADRFVQRVFEEIKSARKNDQDTSEFNWLRGRSCVRNCD